MAGSMAFAGTALTKESYLVFAVAAAAWLAVAVGRRRRVRAAAQAAAVLLPGMLALGLWWAYVACRLPAGAGDRRGVAAVGPPLAGWEHAIGLVVKGQYVPDAQVGPLVAALLVGSGLLAVAAILPGTRRPTLLGWTGLLLGLYGLVLSGLLLDRFLSSMRALAPTVLAAGLAIAAAAITPTAASQHTKAPVQHPRPIPLGR
jgi:hypothetical protein